jgi:mono/diheme cytochrome c family protein
MVAAIIGALGGGCERKIAGGEADGAKIFAEVCARCHGPQGEPNASMVARYGVKNLRSSRVQAEMTDGDIRKQIAKGSENKQMPSFEGAITDEQIAAVIAHVRTFSLPPTGE